MHREERAPREHAVAVRQAAHEEAATCEAAAIFWFVTHREAADPEELIHKQAALEEPIHRAAALEDVTHMEAVREGVIHMQVAPEAAAHNEAAHADATHKQAVAHEDAARREAVLSDDRFLARRNRSYPTSCAAWTIKTRASRRGESQFSSRQQLP
jgi:hypothetical protein